MVIRKLIEDREEKSLSRHAFYSCNSSGRRQVEAACPIRTSFQVDRDRILHSKAFRRLKYKTQVFLSPEGDHYRTRLTHTLEVSQIARTIARALALNEDLAEAIALGHDLGHTPFGHAGERVLNELAPGGFHHVRQSRRVVEVLENDGEGLNLSAEVIDGISKHSKGQGALSKVDREALPATLEGQIVRLADIVAYVNHDLDDALRAGLINSDQIPGEIRGEIGDDHKLWLNTMICDIIEVSLENDSAVIRFSESFDEIVLGLRDWLFMNVYRVKPVNENFERASHVLRGLFHYFLDNPGALEQLGDRIPTSDPPEIAVTDFIAGMTDRFAINLYNEIFIPRPWSVL